MVYCWEQVDFMVMKNKSTNYCKLLENQCSVLEPMGSVSKLRRRQPKFVEGRFGMKV